MEPHLGPLEANVLSILRAGGPATARAILDALHQRGAPVSYTTAGTVLSRLHRRGFVARRREPHRGAFRYVYASLGREDDVLRSMAQEVETLARRIEGPPTIATQDAGVIASVRSGSNGSFRLHA